METVPTFSAGTFPDSSALLGDRASLIARADADGCLFFRGLLPPEPLLELRRDMLKVVRSHGWLKPGTDLMEGALDLEALNRVPESEMRTDIGVSREAYHDIQKLESFHRLPHHPNLLALYRTLFADEVLVHARHIARMVTGHSAILPTPMHQDFPLIQGTSNTWTCWFPIGPCPREMGSLSVLRGSHHDGYIPIQPAGGAGGIAVQLCPWNQGWLAGDFEMGDVLTFPSYTVHRALNAGVPDRIRLSLDVRYQPVREEVEEKSLLPHCSLTWEEIYAGWQQDDLKYYWRRLPLTYSEWDPRLLQPSRRIC